MAVYYATIDQVESQFLNVDFGATGSKISDAEVTEMIERADQVIDAHLASRFTTPVTSASSPKAFKVLTSICVDLVVFRLKTIMNLAGSTPVAGDKPVYQADEFNCGAMKKLRLIQSGELTLVDGELLDDRDGVADLMTDELDCDELDALRQFDREDDNW